MSDREQLVTGISDPRLPIIEQLQLTADGIAMGGALCPEDSNDVMRMCYTAIAHMRYLSRPQPDGVVISRECAGVAAEYIGANSRDAISEKAYDELTKALQEAK